MTTPHRVLSRSAADAAYGVRLLQQLYPPQAVILVGANRHNRHLLDWPGLPGERILLVDAEADNLASLRQHTLGAENWQLRHALLAEQSGEVTYHSASNPGESGLVPVSALTALWPNLRTSASSQRPCQSLQQLLSEAELAELAISEHTWLVVDCLPALRILQGAGKQLENNSVLWLRVLVEPLAEHQPGTTLAEVDEYLTARLYRRVLSFEENHPRLAQVVYLRDDVARQQTENQQLASRCDSLQAEKTALLAERLALHEAQTALLQERDQYVQQASQGQAEITTLTQAKTKLAAIRDQLAGECDQLTQLAAERQGQVEALSQKKAQLTAACDEQAKLASERQKQIEALGKERIELATARDALGKEKAALTLDRDAQAKLANERQAQIETLVKEKAELAAARDALSKEKAALIAARDEQAKLADERQARAEALGQEKAELAAACDALAKETSALVAVRDNQSLQITERDERIRQLESELQGSCARLHLMQDELVKAEAQIDLIKDLLLCEPEL